MNKLADVVRILTDTRHNGFPIIGLATEDSPRDPFLGLILRSQLVTMLQLNAYGPLENGVVNQRVLTHMDFVLKYPQRTPIDCVDIPADMDALYV